MDWSGKRISSYIFTTFDCIYGSVCMIVDEMLYKPAAAAKALKYSFSFSYFYFSWKK